MDYNKYSKDVHTIIDNLSKEERNAIKKAMDFLKKNLGGKRYG